MNEIVDALGLAKRIVMHQARWALLKPPLRHLALVRTPVHRSEVMFIVLVVVLCRDRIAILSFGAGQRQISLIALFHVLKALRLSSG